MQILSQMPELSPQDKLKRLILEADPEKLQRIVNLLFRALAHDLKTEPKEINT